MKQVIPLSASVITVLIMWLAGNRSIWAWVLGIANQFLWFLFIVIFDAWGLFPLCVAMVVVNSRNLMKELRHENMHKMQGVEVSGPIQ